MILRPFHKYAMGMIFTVFLQACSVCDNEIHSVIDSPNQKYSALIFNRACGATTGFNTQISIVSFIDRSTVESGNVFITDGHPKDSDIQVRWETDSVINVSGVGSGRVYLKEETFNGVSITYYP